jgi:hypothetical protein
MNFIATRRIIAMHANRGIEQLSEIPRTARVVENDFLI